MSLALRKNFKLSAHYYRPFKVIEKIRNAAYRLKLPPNSKLHLVFHVSQLKKKIGEGQLVLPAVPNVNEDDSVVPTP